MTSRPLVSTITPCFRMKRYLREFLAWLPRQTWFDRLEIVLDHNEPDDEEIAWVRAFQAAYPGRIKHLLITPVDPIGTSMNRCIREAAGDLVTIWNVDDLRTPESIEAQASYLLGHPETDIVHGPYRVVSAFGATDGPLVDNRAAPESELTRGMLLGPFFMFRKALCAQAGYFDEQLRSGADFDLAIRLALQGCVGATDRELGYYLNEGLGASTRPNSLQPLERTIIELRYGIFDKIDYRYLAPALAYHIGAIRQGEAWIPVGQFVPEHAALLQQRAERWLRPGLQAHLATTSRWAHALRQLRYLWARLGQRLRNARDRAQAPHA